MKKWVFMMAVSVMLLLSVYPAPASAEWFNDFYLGYSFPQDESFTVTTQNSSTSGKADLDNAFVFGYRIGYFFEGLPALGLSIEGSYFEPDPDIGADSELTIIPVTASLLARLPIKASAQFPKGKYQPYIGFGPSIFIASLDYDGAEDTTTELGFEGKAGLAVMLSSKLAFFLEYRYLSVDNLEFDEHIDGSRVDVEADFVSSSGLLGLSYRF